MDWFFLDTHAPDQFRFGWFQKVSSGKIRIRVKTLSGRASHVLLPKLQKEWVSHVKDLTGICVVKGPGAFSAVRTGVIYANLLARILGKSLVGVPVEVAVRLPHLADQLFQGRWASVSYVAPEYVAEPNITLPNPLKPHQAVPHRVKR